MNTPPRSCRPESLPSAGVRPPRRVGRWTALACAIGALLAGGCSHYQLGTGQGPSFHSVFVAPVTNKTMLPQARQIMTTRIREAFARDGRVTLANSAAEADATLTVAIVDYHRDVSATREGDTGLARKFDLTLGVDCTLRQRDGSTLFDQRRVNAQREAFTDSGQLQAEYQTLPLLAEDVATKVVHSALDTW